MFYMVYVEGGRSPTHKHDNPDDPNAALISAVLEAQRLAKLPENIGRRVYVLGAMHYFVAEVRVVSQAL